MTTARRDLNRRLKRWPGWVLLVFVVVAFLAVGATRDSGPRTPDERIEAISKRLACPVCQGESVYESRNTASNQIREAIRQGVDEGELSDEQIIQQITVAYDGEELLVPTGSGVEALAWALPATAFVFGAAGLTIAFRRWQRTAQMLGEATPEDYELVARAMSDEHRDQPGENVRERPARRRDPPGEQLGDHRDPPGEQLGDHRDPSGEQLDDHRDPPGEDVREHGRTGEELSRGEADRS